MLVPRAFGYSSVRPSSKDVDPEKSAPKPRSKQHGQQTSTSTWRGFGWRPESFHKAQPAGPAVAQEDREKASSSPLSTLPNDLDSSRLEQPKTASDTHDTHDTLPYRSTPVAVPLRHQRGQARNSTSSGETQARRRTSTPTSPRQDGRPLPASVAALLASTSIPRKKAFRQPTSTPERMSAQQLMDEWKSGDANDESSISSSPTMDFLLSTPRDDDLLVRSESSESFSLMSRSISSDSMPSLDLDEADESMLSWSTPSTPNASSHRKGKRKAYSRPMSLDMADNHPLSRPSANGIDKEEEEDSDVVFETHTARASRKHSDASNNDFRSTLSSRKPSAFKSNLTASLNSLRNSIRSSLANFSAPTLYTLPEDHLSRGLFPDRFFPYRNEMRPRPLDGPATPELRRYMNPSSYHVRSPAQDFHLHCHGRVIEHIDLEAAAAAAAAASASPSVLEDPNPASPERGAVIALQSFSRVPRQQAPRQHVAAVGITEAGRALGVPEEPHEPQYRRELRENGEFLRICVLEMNMRRAGKFADGVGRARVWLPPREGVFLSAGDELRAGELGQGQGQGQHVPKRWIGVNA